MAGIKGLSKVLKNLNKAIEKQRKQTKAGIMEAGLIIKADSVRETPIDQGNLRNSAFVMVTGLPPDKQSASFEGDDNNKLNSGFAIAQSEGRSIVGKSEFSITGIVAYSAFYALYVHEMPASYNFNSGGNKFLEKSITKNKTRVLKAIAKHAKI